VNCDHGEPEITLRRISIGWYAQIKVTQCASICTTAQPRRLGYLSNSCFALTRRGAERRSRRMVRRLNEGKAAFVF
jgi:hypothetical protein